MSQPTNNSENDVLAKIAIALVAYLGIQLICILYSMESHLHKMTQQNTQQKERVK
jgi:hypothetical protein